uniref:Uncharacterized protein n=1 Tax=Arundo donax TaxID=35708 RepID=A0A0A9FBZ9_ARUDO
MSLVIEKDSLRIVVAILRIFLSKFKFKNHNVWQYIHISYWANLVPKSDFTHSYRSYNPHMDSNTVYIHLISNLAPTQVFPNIFLNRTDNHLYAL